MYVGMKPSDAALSAAARAKSARVRCQHQQGNRHAQGADAAAASASVTSAAIATATAAASATAATAAPAPPAAPPAAAAIATFTAASTAITAGSRADLSLEGQALLPPRQQEGPESPGPPPVGPVVPAGFAAVASDDDSSGHACVPVAPSPSWSWRGSSYLPCPIVGVGQRGRWQFFVFKLFFS